MDYELLSQILPKQPSKWNIDDVRQWLQFIGLESLAEKFKNASIDGSCITYLSEEDLRDQLEIKSSITLKKLNAWIKTGIKEYGQYLRKKLPVPNMLLQTQVNVALNLGNELEEVPSEFRGGGEGEVNTGTLDKEEPSDKDQLVLQQLQGPTSFYILKEEGGKIGRHKESVSRHHAEIQYDNLNRQYYIRDNGSTTGTFIKLAERIQLEEGMLIEMGSNQFLVVHIEGPEFKLSVIEGTRNGEEFIISVKKNGSKLGRKESNDISFPEDAHLSNVHCVFTYMNNLIYFQDWTTTNGTWLRLCPQAIKSTKYLIKDRMVFKIGSSSTFMCYRNKSTTSPLLKSESKSYEDHCCICFQSEKDCVFIPCKHNSTCVKCAKSVKECPICKIEIQDFIKIYRG